MILELNSKNIESLKLEKQGYSKEDINQLMHRKTNISLNDAYFDYENQKIHTGIDMARYFLNKESNYKRFPFNYPDLIPDYYNIKLENFLNDKKRLLGIIFNDFEQTKEFINEQIKETQIIIDENKSKELKHSLNSRKNNITVQKGYVWYLEKRLYELEENAKNKSFISKRVKNLFNFIDFLHSNIGNFKSYDKTIESLHSLDEQRNALTPEKNFKEKLKYDEIQNELEQKFKIIDNNIIQKIKEKTIKFDICNWNDTNTIWHSNITDIRKLKDNFTESDIQIIQKNKEKYLQFRKQTNQEYFCKIFFIDLDRILTEIFDYFNESQVKEFENFKSKPVELNNFNDLVQVLKSKVDFGEIIYDNDINQEDKSRPKETKKPYESYKTEILFKVGLLFASGKMEKYYTLNKSNKTIFKEGYSAPQVAKDLGFENYNKFILATINNYPIDNSNGNKNIFNSLDKMTKVIQHCKENNIEVIPYFIERLPTE